MEPGAKEFLKELTEVMSPSGYEEEASKLWQKRAKGFADEVFTDVHGNTIAVLNRDGKPKVMLAGHIDEIGFMVKYIDDNGMLYFAPIGGVDVQIAEGQRVRILGKGGKIIKGAIGKKPIHLLDPKEREKIPKFHELWVDIGAKNREEAEELVEIGAPMVIDYGFEELRNGIVMGRGFDDRVGAFVVLEALRFAKEKGIEASLYSVATVQEEIGLRGAWTSTFHIHPDVGIAVDVTFATDQPGVDKKRIGEVKLGGGPVIARGPNINPKVFKLLVETAEEEGIPYQIEGIPRGTGTDANIMQLTRGGVATGLVSIPTRYMHTPCEFVHLDDLENAAKLLAYFTARLNKDSDFRLFM